MQTQTIETMAGDHISKVIAKAIAQAKAHDCLVRFTFNDIDMGVSPVCEQADMEQRFDAEIKRRNEEWKISPAGQKYAAERAAEIAKKQGQIDGMLAFLPVTFPSAASAIKWLITYADVADDIGVKADHAKVIATLEAGGWTKNDATGLLDTEYQKPDIMARYVIGQALDALHRGMPPHPMIGQFGKQYLAATAGNAAGRSGGGWIITKTPPTAAR